LYLEFFFQSSFLWTIQGDDQTLGRVAWVALSDVQKFFFFIFPLEDASLSQPLAPPPPGLGEPDSSTPKDGSWFPVVPYASQQFFIVLLFFKIFPLQTS